jgi:hypothetical protein
VADAERASYRNVLVELEQKAQGEYDKTVLTLAGGALGVSFAFVKDFLGKDAAKCPTLLVGAWIAWVASLAFILLSHYLSTLALRTAIEQFDSGKLPGERAGGMLDIAVVVFNAAGGLAFLAGSLIMGWFVSKNVG